MSEADTPQSFNSSFDQFDQHNNFATNDSIDELISALDETASVTTNTASDDALFEEEAKENQSAELTNQVHEPNHELLNRSAQLQKELETTQAQLKQHQFRLRQAEDLNVQQNDELNAAYEQNLSLSQELKTLRQKEQQQQEKITNLSHQLQVSQQRVAQLERECALIQKQFQEQSYKLCQAEKQSRELSLRLQQQRRHTWQFKCALNKYLETNDENYSNDAFSLTSAPSQPITAWSNQQVNSTTQETTQEPDSLTVSSLTEEEKSLPEITASSSEETPVNASEQTFSATENTEVNAVEEPMDVAISFTNVESTLAAESEEPTHENTPSPTVTSHQNRKKRQSYAAVELPNFIR